ncbi:MAG TPA: PGPGW domain-containing protein [Nocardioidaceae bacterium]|nr:PGPGW domain-containing protein [Nocardioidaceae bacterium]
MTTEEHPPEAGSRPARERSSLHRWLHANPAMSLTTKIVVTTIGVLVLLGGVLMMVTPGPGIVGIALGLAILATEYEWAHRWLQKAREKAHEARLKAEAMDPKVRRRQLLVSGLVFLALTAGVVTYVAIYDWPAVAVDGWDWVQGLAGWVPDLPGM